MSVGARRPPENISPSDSQRLRQAHERLRNAVKTAEQYVGREPLHRAKTSDHRQDDLESAYREIDEAEAQLWRIREELLGWQRPSSAPPARDVLDWFSEEDKIYDSEE